MDHSSSYTVFAGYQHLVSGDWPSALKMAKYHLDAGGEPVLIFDDETGQQVDADFSGTLEDVLRRASADATSPAAKPGPGRPKLGVVSREVSLLPRHWAWLQEQPNGVSATLRRLVDDARKRTPRAQRLRDAAYRFIWALAGNFENAEEAIRALYAKEDAQLEALMERWPSDVREHVLKLVAQAWREERGVG
jgi:hypothetical protein